MNKLIEIFEAEKCYFDIPQSAEEFGKEEFEKNYETIYWQSADRIRHHISEMSSNHISNCLNYLLRSGLDDHYDKTYWMTIFRLELIKRDENYKKSKERVEILQKKVEELLSIKYYNDELYEKNSELEEEVRTLEQLHEKDQEQIKSLKSRLIKRNQEEINLLKSILICLEK